jgi:2-hydroxy-3-keto-5-methylthiopentenyl-1-phosphate phosphatase
VGFPGRSILVIKRPDPVNNQLSLKILVQCDFDSTITEEDISYYILDSFAQGDWRKLLKEYREGRISVDQFNTGAFALVKADKDTLIDTIKRKFKVRAGFHQLVAYCSHHNFRLVIVSNGLDFYIKEILSELGFADIEVHAAQTQFYDDKLAVKYIGPDGKQMEDGLKEMYIKLFLQYGYKVIYIGDGESDIKPARHAYKIFARDHLLSHCNENNIPCEAFDDLGDVVKKLELLNL